MIDKIGYGTRTIRLHGNHDVQELVHVINSGAIDNVMKSIDILVDFDYPQLGELISSLGNLPKLHQIKISFGNCRGMDGEASGIALEELVKKRPIKNILVDKSRDQKFDEHVAKAAFIADARANHLERVIDVIGKYTSAVDIDKLLISYAGLKESVGILPLLPDAVQGLLEDTTVETADRIRTRAKLFTDAVAKAHGPQGAEQVIGGGMLPAQLRELAGMMEDPVYQQGAPAGKMGLPTHYVETLGGLHTVRVDEKSAKLEV